ncbi:RDD family protein [Pseudonocardia eucalypti]|uniref:RDD family protein n=1 Tax=Pseudonocardia eucalypti TaxID=648755 RepID=A0ABP9QPY0_9PSEU|nr:putative RDD family membrane protein YckC [Pseudonocardia eucalypti]
MSRWTESWLPGAGPSPAEDGYPGERLGLPEHGPESVAGLGRRAVAFAVDLLLSAALAWGFTAPAVPGNWSLLAWALLTVIPTSVFGMTPGMTVFGLRVARLGGAKYVGVPRALLRTALLFFILPAVINDADGRGIHDRLVGTVVVRTR